MVRREMRLTAILDDQIRRQSERLQRDHPEHDWTESAVVRWCLALGLQAVIEAERRGQAPGCGPDLSRAIERSWDQWDQVFGDRREGGGRGE